ncbi:MAG TPA: ABC transporter substrate-binding protein [Aggregatilinea sp.]|uniref:ABC transporter substrate-binding protein n=1 Tax=Aggregatilinea sp. TaxID=2806333 RepID=UPI002C2D9AD1|nr:ABC transporter substrate-binding protein [Aggregatilinea sp.]HML20021.1 ABC transporter substrate-binding protein [Aggregatilinea sp.]
MRPLIPASKRTITLYLLAALVVSLSLSVAPVAAYPQAQSDTPVTLYTAAATTTTLDPLLISRFDPTSHDLVENLFVGLTRFDPVTQQVEPMIAESWSVSDDGLTWTFNLRDDIQWVRYDAGTDAVTAVRPIQAGDFVYAIQRACNPLRPSPVTTNMMLVQGCQTVANAFPEVITDLMIAREIGVRATGPYTLEIDIVVPASYFPTLVSTSEFRPVAREAVADEGDWTSAERIITSGPYALKSRSASAMTLVRNSLWPDAFSGNVDQIEVALTDAIGSAVPYDMVRLTAAEADALRTSASSALAATPANQITALGFATDRAVVDSTDARRAFSLAIDRQALIDQFFPNQAVPALAFTPAGVAAAPDVEGLGFDPAAARAAFAAAGYPDCTNLPEQIIVLVPEEDPIWTTAGQFLVDQWVANLGCAANMFQVVPLERKLMIELSHGTYDSEAVTRSHSWIVQWSADYPDANAWINDALHCRYGWISTGRACDQGDSALDRAVTEEDLDARTQDYATAEEAMFGPNGTFPVIPLFVTTTTWIQQPWLTDVNEYGAARFDLWTIDPDAQSAR